MLKMFLFHLQLIASVLTREDEIGLNLDEPIPVISSEKPE